MSTTPEGGHYTRIAACDLTVIRSRRGFVYVRDYRHGKKLEVRLVAAHLVPDAGATPPPPARRTIPLRVHAIAFVLALMILPVAASAQNDPTIPFTPGVKITALQRAQIDSIVVAYATEGRLLLARQDSMGKSVPARIALRRKYRNSVRNVLTNDQRIGYDAWYEAAEAVHEARRPAHTTP